MLQKSRVPLIQDFSLVVISSCVEEKDLRRLEIVIYLGSYLLYLR